jgi:transcription elongation GreA/GreB family factor
LGPEPRAATDYSRPTSSRWWVCLVDSDDKQQQLFLGPDGGSMKLVSGAQLVQVISSEAPLGRAILGKCEGDEVSIQVAPVRQLFEVLRVH